MPLKALFSTLMLEKYDLLMGSIYYEMLIMETHKDKMKLFF